MSFNLDINNNVATNAAGYDGMFGTALNPGVKVLDPRVFLLQQYLIGNELPYIATAKGIVTDIEAMTVAYSVATRSGHRVPQTQNNEDGTIITNVNLLEDTMSICNIIKRGLKVSARDRESMAKIGSLDMFRKLYQDQEGLRDLENINITSYHAIISGIAKENTGYRNGYTRHNLFLGNQANPYDLDAAARNSTDYNKRMDSLSRYLLRMVTLAGSYGLANANNVQLPTQAAVSSLTFVVPFIMYPYVMQMYARMTRNAAQPENYPLVTGRYIPFVGFNVLLSHYVFPIKNPQGSGMICPIVLLDTNMVSHAYLPLYIDNEYLGQWKDTTWETEIYWGTKLLRKDGAILGQVLIDEALTSVN